MKTLNQHGLRRFTAAFVAVLILFQSLPVHTLAAESSAMAATAASTEAASVEASVEAQVTQEATGAQEQSTQEAVSQEAVTTAETSQEAAPTAEESQEATGTQSTQEATEAAEQQATNVAQEGATEPTGAQSPDPAQGTTAAAEAATETTATGASSTENPAAGNSATGAGSATDSATGKSATGASTAVTAAEAAVRTYEFYDDSDSLLSKQELKNGDTLKKPEDLKAREGSTFLGWFIDGTDEKPPFGEEITDIEENETVAVRARFEVVEEEKETYPAQTFDDRTATLEIHVQADEGTFPANTTMKLAPVPKQKAIDAAQEAIDNDPDRDEEVVDVLAVDITFYDGDGEELQPKKVNGVHVTLSALRALKGETQDVAHMENLLDDAKETRTTILESHETDINADITENRSGETVAQNLTASFDAEHFSVYAIIGTDGAKTGDTVRRIYKYYTSDNDRDFTLHKTQIYKNGDILTEPALPKRSDGNAFIGWYSGNGEAHLNGTGHHALIAFDEVITDIDENRTTDEIIEVHAHFATEVIVRFYNAPFTDVIDIEEGETGETISFTGISPQLTSSERHVGWMKTNSNGVPVDASGTIIDGGADLFNGTNSAFTGNLTSGSFVWYPPNGTITLGTEKIYLRAIISESNKLEFFENTSGDTDTTPATYTAPVYVPMGSAATTHMPAAPTREGYDFGGWYMETGCTTPFDDTLVTSTEYKSLADRQGVIKLYAKWVPKQTTYDVYIWREVLTDGIRESDPAKKKYEAVLFYTGEDAYQGIAGQQAVWTQALREAFEASPDATSPRSEDGTFDYRYYEYNAGKTSNVTIRGDGSSILHVYYDLKEFTLTYTLQGEQVWNSTKYVTYHTKVEMNGITYTHENPYVISVVLGQSVSDLWPNPSDVTVEESILVGDFATDTWNKEHVKVLAWKSKPGSGNKPTNSINYLGVRPYIVKQIISDYYGEPLNNTFTVLVWRDYDTALYNRQIWLEGTDGQFHRSDFYSKTMLVTATYTTTPTAFKGYTLVRETDRTGSGTEEDPYVIQYYYERNKHTVELHNYNNIYESDPIKTGAEIPTSGYTGKASGAVLTDVTHPPVPDGLGDHYTFDGWYEDRAYTIPFDFTGAVMEDENITLYAKWVPKQVTVTFDAGGGSFAADADDASAQITLSDEVTVNGGETRYKKATVTATAGEVLGNSVPLNPSRDRYTFRNWLLNGTRVDFTQREFMDSVTLTASWHEDAEVTVYYFKTQAQAQALDPSNSSTANSALAIYAGNGTSRNYRYGGHLAVLDGTTTVGNNVLQSTYTDANGVRWEFVGWRAVGTGIKTYLPGEVLAIEDGSPMIKVSGSGSNEKDAIAFYPYYESIAQQATTITCYSNYPAFSGFPEETHVINTNAERADYKNTNTGDLLVNYETKAPASALIFPQHGGNVTGYTFAGWNTKADGSGTAIVPGASIAADLIAKESYPDSATNPQINRLYAQWTPNPCDYTIRHVVLKLNSTTEYEELDRYTRSGTYDAVASAVAHTFEGMDFDWTTTKSKAEVASQAWRDSTKTGGNTTYITGITTGTPQTIYGIVTEKDASNPSKPGLVLTLYYTRKTYKVNYAYEGHVPASAQILSESNYNTSQGYVEIPYGKTVEVNDADLHIDGASGQTAYTFSGWTTTDVTTVTDSTTNQRTFTMPDHDVHITGHFTPETGGSVYYVHHYVEMRDDEVRAVSGLDSLSDGQFMKVTANATGTDYKTYKNVGGKLYRDIVTPVNRHGTALQFASAPARSFRGYTFDASTTQNQMKTAVVENDDDTRMSSVSPSGGDNGLDISYDSTNKSVRGRILTTHSSEGGNGPLVLQLFYGINRKTLTYQYEGTVPAGVTDPPADTSGTVNATGTTTGGNYHAYGETVTIAADPQVPGYTFTGWHTLASSSDLSVDNDDRTFVMPNRSVILQGYFTANTNTEYTVWHFGEVLEETINASSELTTWKSDSGRQNHDTTVIGGKTYCYYNSKVYELLSTPAPQTLTGTTDSKVYPAVSTPGGFTSAGAFSGTYDSTGATPSFTGASDYSAATGVSITGDGKLQVRFLYDRRSFKVTYAYDMVKNEAPGTLPAEPAVQTNIPYGTTVTKEGTLSYADAIPGYTFHGWDRAYSTADLSETTSGGVTTFKMPARDVLFNGYYTAAEVEYRTQYFKELLDESAVYTTLAGLDDSDWSQDTDKNTVYILEGTKYYKANNTYYRLEEEVTGTAKTGTSVNAEQKTYPGFTFDTVSDSTSSGRVMAEQDASGVTVGKVQTAAGFGPMKMYYDIDRNRLVYMYAGDIPQEANALLPAAGVYEYGHHIQVNAGSATQKGYDKTGNTVLAVTGYDFHGWMTEYDYYKETGNMPDPAPQEVHVGNDGKLAMPDRTTVLYGYFTPGKKTPYKVEHYRAALDGTYPATPQETENLTGVTGARITAAPKNYPGFSIDDMMMDGDPDSGVITPDGSLVLKLYYARESYDYTYEITAWPSYESNGTVPTGGSDIPYGERVTLAKPKEYPGYHFVGWTGTVSGGTFTVTTDAATGTQTMTMPAGNAILTGYYEADENTETGKEGDGYIIAEVDIKPGTPIDGVTGMNTELARDELTSKELAEDVRTDGDTARIWLEIVALDEAAVPAEDPQLIKEAAQLKDTANTLTTLTGNPAGILYLDISLHKEVTDGAGQTVISDTQLEYFGDTETGSQTNNGNAQEAYDGKTVRVRASVPQSIIDLPLAPGFRREYAVFRVHRYQGTQVDGNAAGKLAEKLAGWTTDTTLSFETGLFCTYAIVWKDEPVQTTPATGGTTATGGGTGATGNGTGSTGGGGDDGSGSGDGGSTGNVVPQSAAPQGVIQLTSGEPSGTTQPINTTVSGNAQTQGERGADTGDNSYDRMVFWAMIFLAAVTVLMERVHKMIEEDIRIAKRLAGKRKATP